MDMTVTGDMDITVTHDRLARREETVRLGLWMFLATVAMLFAAFASAYIVRRSGSDWTPINLPATLWWSTAVLAASSGALEAAHAGGRRGRATTAGGWLAATLALGLGFLAGQLTAWRHLIEAGVYMPASPHASFFYLLTGAHALHVAGALTLLAYATLRTWTGLPARDRRRWIGMMDSTRTFWHFLLGVWLFVYTLLALF